jgi:hypothetical protein
VGNRARRASCRHAGCDRARQWLAGAPWHFPRCDRGLALRSLAVARCRISRSAFTRVDLVAREHGISRRGQDKDSASRVKDAISQVCMDGQHGRFGRGMGTERLRFPERRRWPSILPECVLGQWPGMADRFSFARLVPDFVTRQSFVPDKLPPRALSGIRRSAA